MTPLIAGIDWSSLGTVAGTMVLAITALITVLSTRRELRDLSESRAADSQVYGEIMTAWSRVQGLFHTDLMAFKLDPARGYFYGPDDEDAKSPPTSEFDCERLDFFCEVLMDFLDTVVEQRYTSEAESDWSTWYRYFRALYRYSPVFREWIKDNGDWYPDYELAALGLVNVRESQSGILSSCFVMKEVVGSNLDQFRAGTEGYGLSNRDRLPREPGFPWITQWIIEPRQLDDEPADPTGERATGAESSPPTIPNVEGATDPVRTGVEAPPERATARRAMCARVFASEAGSAIPCAIHLYAGNANELNDSEQETILGWLLGTVTDSSLIEQVMATVYYKNAEPVLRTYQIRDRPASALRHVRPRYVRQESFLIKQFVYEKSHDKPFGK
jgi:hypothetical protein